MHYFFFAKVRHENDMAEIEQIQCMCISASNVKEENLEDVEVFVGNINVKSTEVNTFTYVS